jgi:hypothetical protein
MQLRMRRAISKPPPQSAGGRDERGKGKERGRGRGKGRGRQEVIPKDDISVASALSGAHSTTEGGQPQLGVHPPAAGQPQRQPKQRGQTRGKGPKGEQGEGRARNGRNATAAQGVPPPPAGGIGKADQDVPPGIGGAAAVQVIGNKH